MNGDLDKIARLVRYYILTSTTVAGSGHPTSSLSAVDLMVGLMFGGNFRFRVDEPRYHNNDRLIFSKGHASPLFYALWAVAGKVSEEEMITLRKFDSRLEGHPTKRFPYTEVATGSLGQGLSVGVGMALAAKMDGLGYRTYVLLGDSEMAEGSNWEAMQVATNYKLDNLIGVIDVNRLGQSGETMVGHDVETYRKRIESFGWEVEVVDGHDESEISSAYERMSNLTDRPGMIVAKTYKGKGVSLFEDRENWHGKVLNQQQLKEVLSEFGPVDKGIRGMMEQPEAAGISNDKFLISNQKSNDQMTNDKVREPIEIDTDEDYQKPLATRKAYGHALVEWFPKYPQMVVLDAEVSNSSYAATFKQAHPDKYWEMFIAEQNMVGVAVGLAARGKIPWVSTFASFFTRAMDQIRVAQYTGVNVNFVGSHVGVSIGEDGPTQMGLEDIAVFRAILGSVVLYPADHVASEKLVGEMMVHPGICYMRTTRMDTDPLYIPKEEFVIGGSKVLRFSESDQVTLIGAGVTLYECLEAYERMSVLGIKCRVIDLYSVKPVDVETLVRACKETKALVVVEDHFAEGGMAEVVRSSLVHEVTPVHSLAVRKIPRSGKPEELLAYEGIDANSIVNLVNSILNN